MKEHRFFKGISWDGLLAKRLKAPYVPLLKYESIRVRGMDDARYFAECGEVEVKGEEVKPEEDPFAAW